MCKFRHILDVYPFWRALYYLCASLGATNCNRLYDYWSIPFFVAYCSEFDMRTQITIFFHCTFYQMYYIAFYMVIVKCILLSIQRRVLCAISRSHIFVQNLPAHFVERVVIYIVIERFFVSFSVI